tara:strand:- start:693 stop:947 length:255 start_codon:yes stop_codon:yes gene_type:complete
MIKKIFLVLTLMIGFNNIATSKELKCDQFKKFSMEYMKCKGNSLKNKSISVGKNFVENTKEFQKKTWSEEKKKWIKVKEKVLYK